MTSALFGSILILVFCFAMTNGFLDGGGIISTVIATRALNPIPALILVALCEACGLFVLGHAVAKTVGTRLLAFPAGGPPDKILWVLVCALLGALGWNVLMWRWSLPTSSSHALIGGLLGASLVGFGVRAIHWPVAAAILVFLGVGPWLSAGISFTLAKALRWAGQFVAPAVTPILHKAHALVSGGLALAHGSMDGQKSLAILWMAMGALTVEPMRYQFLAPFLCSAALTLGVIVGSHRTMRTLGRGLYPMQSHQGLCAESAAMALVGLSALLGWPVATSHAMSSAVIGAGVATHPRGIRWGMASDIVLAWIFTIPSAAILAAVLFAVFQRGLHVVP